MDDCIMLLDFARVDLLQVINVQPQSDQNVHFASLNFFNRKAMTQGEIFIHLFCVHNFLR